MVGTRKRYFSPVSGFLFILSSATIDTIASSSSPIPASSLCHPSSLSGALDVPISTGTTLVAARFGPGPSGSASESGIIIGADSRTSRGSYISNRGAKKLNIVRPNIVVARSGSAADTQSLTEELALELSDLERSSGSEKLRVSTAAHILRRYSYASKDKLSASLICAGWDSTAGFQLYTIVQGGSLMQSTSFAIAGSGSSFIYGWCDRSWREKMSRDECIEFVSRAIELAKNRDGSSGGPTNLIEIEYGGECKPLQSPIFLDKNECGVKSEFIE